MATSGRPGAPYPKSFRLSHTRRKTGCLPCRRRKKKCDETRPNCTACKRNNLDCEWPRSTTVPDASSTLPSRLSRSAGDLSPSIQSSQAFKLTPESFRLLEHYTSITATEFPAYAMDQSQNPYISHILPVAYEDELMMHVVLAVSGAHLSHKLPNVPSLGRATQQHYSYALRSLQREIQHCFSRDTKRVIHLLFVAALLCVYEVLAGSTYKVLSFHLRAIKQGLRHLRDVGYSIPARANETEKILRFICEGYSYMEFCNLITPTPQVSIPSDFIPIVSSLLGQSIAQPLSPVFGGSRLLFELIPQANALLYLRLTEQAEGHVEPTSSFMHKHTELSSAIEAWKMALPIDDSNGSHSLGTEQAYLSAWAQSSMVAECIRNALRIYMMAAFLGSQPPTPDIELAIQHEVLAFAQTSRAIMDTSCASIILWALIVVATCTRDDFLRREIIYSLDNSRYQMRHLGLVRQALVLLWADASSGAFGPYGLQLVMEKNNIGFCIF